ncbi:MAG: zinc ribbon domain-containing protein [Propionibacteriaceae bacterium]|nr:zinc ribbon domain-containing protein [Propionibacteriaceae bacterium]
MPTYQYCCKSCGQQLEAVQAFTDAALTQCPECDGELRKVFSAVGVVFKGSGFYATDNRTKSKNSASAKPAETTDSKPDAPATQAPAKTETPAASETKAA